jgi:type I restriction enzyme S subunit
LKIGDLNDGLVTSAEENITTAGLKGSSATLLPPHTLLIAMYGSIGKMGITGFRCATNQAIAYCYPKIDLKYLFWALRSSRQRLNDLGKGGTQMNVSQTVLKEFEIPIAPAVEQHRIVAKIEALLEQVNRAKARLDRVPLILKRFRQAVLASACSGDLTADWREGRVGLQPLEVPEATERPTRNRRRGANLSGDRDLLIDEGMPELPSSWNYARLDRLTEPGTVITYGIVLPGPEILGGVPYVRQQDIVNGAVVVEQLRRTSPEIARKHERSSVRAGDVLL